MVSGLELIASAGLWGMSFALLWQAGYGHSRPTCNREAQQGSVKLNFLHGLRLLTSTEGSVNLHHHRLSIWFCNTKKKWGGKEDKVAYHLHSSSAVLNLIKLSDWIISKHLYISRRLHRLQSSTRVTLDCQGNYCHSLHKHVRQVGPDAAEPTNTYSSHRLIFRAGVAVVARPSSAGKLSLVQDQSYSSSWKAFFFALQGCCCADLSQKPLSVQRAALGEIAASYSMCQGALRLSLTTAC